jgi:hypothetical protein
MALLLAAENGVQYFEPARVRRLAPAAVSCRPQAHSAAEIIAATAKVVFKSNTHSSHLLGWAKVAFRTGKLRSSESKRGNHNFDAMWRRGAHRRIKRYSG